MASMRIDLTKAFRGLWLRWEVGVSCLLVAVAARGQEWPAAEFAPPTVESTALNITLEGQLDLGDKDCIVSGTFNQVTQQ